MKDIVLNGINGANPLGFLAALGATLTLESSCSNLKLGWNDNGAIWRPFLRDCTISREQLSAAIFEELETQSNLVLELDKKLPYAVNKFADALTSASLNAAPAFRRHVDQLCAFGTEIHSENGQFADTDFRMVRSGDSVGQGLPAYALKIRHGINAESIERTLFKPWDYADDGSSLRWDPIEDQRHALRWNDPSLAANKKTGPKTMRGANCLALEALALFPVMPLRQKQATTGFRRNSSRKRQFTWPIWTTPIGLPIIRSLLALNELHKPEKPSRKTLAAMGIIEVYRSTRIPQNQYYSNFTPASPA